ncbi:hypothetical protein BDZ97DRAFT_1769755 [Flammula alnicola]|nr:hypothetical protein BDZ97DRAFT_1769755 [Flammula alnicola]
MDVGHPDNTDEDRGRPAKRRHDTTKGRREPGAEQHRVQVITTPSRGRRSSRSLTVSRQRHSAQDDDIKMASPPKEKIPAHGSSRSTGGVFRGRAMGNNFNMADASEVWRDMDVPVHTAESGRIFVYLSQDNPANISIANTNPSFTVSVRDIYNFPTFQTVVERATRDYSPVRDNSYRFFMLEDDNWSIKGRYEAISKREPTDEDYIQWTKNDQDKYIVHVLGSNYEQNPLFLPGFAGRLGSSFGSRSGSGSASGSRLPSYSRLPSRHPANMPIFQEGSSKSTQEAEPATYQARLMEELAISEYFTDRKKSGLRFAWSKYVECNKAIKLGKSLVESGKWAEDLPRFNENLIIEVFIGKSAWHANYTKNFSAVQTKYPDMVDWLESETSTKEEDVKVWGVYKKDYVFSDLKELVDNGGKLKVKKKKKKHSSSEDEGTGKGKQPQRRSLLLICLGLVSLLEYLGLSLLWSLLCLMSAVLPVSATLPLYMKLLVFAIFLPLAAAVPQTQAFPDIPFKVFSAFVENTFSSEVSLATVLLVLFSMTENTELLNLHARQQIPEFDGENRTLATGWIRAFSRAIMHKMKRDVQALFLEREFPPTRYHQVTKLSTKLDAFAKLLNLTPYDDENNFKTKLLPVSYDAIQAVQTLCPDSMFCMNAQCDPRALLQATKTTDIPLVTLIKDNTVYQDVPVLTGKCNTCDTTYHADHERFKDGHGLWNKCYLNSARYLKVGQSTWVDRKFSHTVLSGMYDFHASAAAYTQFWNDSTSVNSSDFQITRRQIWQTFIQESVRMVASTRKTNLELRENLNINEVTKKHILYWGILEYWKMQKTMPVLNALNLHERLQKQDDKHKGEPTLLMLIQMQWTWIMHLSKWLC